MVSDGSPPSANGSEPGIRVTSGDGATVVWLIGEHDVATVPVLREELVAVTAHGTDVVVDLSGAQFIDCSTLRLLEEARDRVEAASARLVLRNPAPLARRVLTICGIEFDGGPHAGGDHGLENAAT